MSAFNLSMQCFDLEEGACVHQFWEPPVTDEIYTIKVFSYNVVKSAVCMLKMPWARTISDG